MKPSQEYTIHILEDEDFDLLPVGNPKDMLGMADPKRKMAWVRRTHVRDLDMGTINHEFDELISGTSLHEIDGIRYKSGGGLGKIIGPVVGALLSFINPALGIAVGAAISGGTQAHSQSVKPEKYGSGMGGILSSAALGGLGAYTGGSILTAGRAAATNAAIAAGKGVGTTTLAQAPLAANMGLSQGIGLSNTLSGIGAGLKGAAGAAMGKAGSYTLSGIKSAMTSDQPALAEVDTASNPFALSPFAPTRAQDLTTSPGPLSDLEYAQGLNTINANLSNRLKNLNLLFRGQTTKQNTAYQKQAEFTRKSAAESTNLFKQQQEEAKRIAGVL